MLDAKNVCVYYCLATVVCECPPIFFCTLYYLLKDGYLDYATFCHAIFYLTGIPWKSCQKIVYCIQIMAIYVFQVFVALMKAVG